MFLSSLGDGMNAYVAYKVSTRVYNPACVNSWLSLAFAVVPFSCPVTDLPPDLLAHVQE